MCFAIEERSRTLAKVGLHAAIRHDARAGMPRLGAAR